MAQKKTAFEYYAEFTNYILGSHELNESYLLLLQEAIIPLRFYLTCRVCSKMLRKPMSPDHTVCQHTVCHQCIGGKMKLRPSCGWCQNYEHFIENRPLAGLIKCYSKLCQYALSSAEYRKQVHFASQLSNSSSFDSCKDSVASLLKEGWEVSVNAEEDVTIATREPDVQLIGKGRSDTPPKHPSKRGGLILKLSMNGSKKKRGWHTNRKKHSSGRLSKKTTIKFRKKKVADTTSVVLEEPGSLQRMDTNVDKQRTSEMDNCLDSSSPEIPTSGGRTRFRRQDRVKIEKKGCGCGNTTTTPGKLTCYGQRCPCYSSHNTCLECRCRGCRNPNKVTKIEQASEDTDGDEINVE